MQGDQGTANATARLIARVPYGGWRIRAGACKVATVDYGFGSTDIAIPAQVLVLAGGRPVRVVWHNGVGGVTCEYGEGEGRLAARPPKVNLNLGKDDWPKGDQ